MKKQAGFTLIELVIVVIILGLLFATALPRFLNITEQAEEAAVEGIAGGFASAVGLVRAQWEVAGRPVDNVGANVTSVTVDGAVVGINTEGTIRGYPTGEPVTNTNVSAMSADRCLQTLNLILQNPPSASTTFATSNTLFVRYEAPDCFYHQTTGLGSAPTSIAASNGFSYNPASGQISIFLNKP